MMLCILDLKACEYMSEEGALSPDSSSPGLLLMARAFMMTLSCLNAELVNELVISWLDSSMEFMTS